MTEKRFWFEKECTEDFFTEKGVFYNNGRPMGANEIIALLNSLSEENEQLKSLVDACEYGQKSLMEEMKCNDEALDKIWGIMTGLYGVEDE